MENYGPSQIQAEGPCSVSCCHWRTRKAAVKEMGSKSSTGPAMTLANMCEIGVRSIEATCECGHRAVVDLSGFRLDRSAFTAPSF